MYTVEFFDTITERQKTVFSAANEAECINYVENAVIETVANGNELVSISNNFVGFKHVGVFFSLTVVKHSEGIVEIEANE